MRSNAAAYVAVFTTVLLTVYGQLVFKWRINDAGDYPSPTGERVEYVLRLFLDPWVVSVFVAALAASVTWALALTRFELSFAYPFMALSFVLTLLFGVMFLSEDFNWAKVIALVLVVAGLVVGSQS